MHIRREAKAYRPLQMANRKGSRKLRNKKQKLFRVMNERKSIEARSGVKT
jgi:hypothetical protein